jgi:predicted lysophospholipase L1 biosynthesis ABC-type transport system permease subunit
VGVLLGVLLSFGLVGFSKQFLNTGIHGALQLEPIYTGLVVGVVATTVFGFLPTLAASRVRPNVLLRPQASLLPRSGRILSLGVILLLTAVMGLVASVLLDNLLIGMLAAYGALVILSILVTVLLGVVWAIGRLPHFGNLNLKLASRGLSRHRGRAASTLLALSVGLFAIGSVVFLADSTKKLIDQTVMDQAAGSVLVFMSDTSQEARDRLSQGITNLGGTNVVESHYYLVWIQTPREPGLYGRRLAVRTAGPAGTGAADDEPLVFVAGRDLGPEDAGKPVVVAHVPSGFFLGGTQVGDRMSFTVGAEIVSDVGPVGGQTVVLEVVGLTRDELPGQGFFDEGDWLTPLGAFDLAITPPEATTYALTVPESEVPAIVDQLNRNVSGAVAVAPTTTTSVYHELIDRFTVFPMIVSGLALFAAAVIIANSVALATMERRREIAMMKAVGAKSSRVLVGLLLENGILGLFGGAIGVALSVVVLVGFNRLQPEIPVAPDPLSVIVVLAVAVGVASAAAVLSAWPASRERPLTVLRYE